MRTCSHARRTLQKHTSQLAKKTVGGSEREKTGKQRRGRRGTLRAIKDAEEEEEERRRGGGMEEGWFASNQPGSKI